jgi:hypothetical protein
MITAVATTLAGAITAPAAKAPVMAPTARAAKAGVVTTAVRLEPDHHTRDTVTTASLPAVATAQDLGGETIRVRRAQVSLVAGIRRTRHRQPRLRRP